MNEALQTINTVAAIVAGLVAGRFVRGSTAARVGLGILAAMVVAGALGAARPVITQLLYEHSDDYAWSMVRKSMLARAPGFKDILALDASIETELKSEILPRMRQIKDPDDPGLAGIGAAAASKVFHAKIFPVAIHGSDDALNSWGATILPVVRAMRNASAEACGDYLVTGVNRLPPTAAVDTRLEATQRALAEAYRSSDRTKYPRTTPDALENAYADAVKLVQPPFSEAELAAFDALATQPKARVCDLMTRLYVGIEKLPPKNRAVVYRDLMAQ